MPLKEKGSKSENVNLWLSRVVRLRRVHDLLMGSGLPPSAPSFQQDAHFQLPKCAFILTFPMNFGGKLPVLNYFC